MGKGLLWKKDKVLPVGLPSAQHLWWGVLGTFSDHGLL